MRNEKPASWSSRGACYTWLNLSFTKIADTGFPRLSCQVSAFLAAAVCWEQLRNCIRQFGQRSCCCCCYQLQQQSHCVVHWLWLSARKWVVEMPREQLVDTPCTLLRGNSLHCRPNVQEIGKRPPLHKANTQVDILVNDLGKALITKKPWLMMHTDIYLRFQTDACSLK